MLKIMAKFPLDKIELNDNFNIVDRNIELFYEVYNIREFLTLKELMILQETCVILKNLFYFCIFYDKSEKDKYHQYSENINNLIELKKRKK